MSHQHAGRVGHLIAARASLAVSQISRVGHLIAAQTITGKLAPVYFPRRMATSGKAKSIVVLYTRQWHNPDLRLGILSSL